MSQTDCIMSVLRVRQYSHSSLYSHYPNSHNAVSQYVTRHRPTVSWVSSGYDTLLTLLSLLTLLKFSQYSQAICDTTQTYCCHGRRHLSPLITTYYSHYSNSHKTILQSVTQHRPTVSWVSASLSSVITDITFFTDITQILTIQSVNTGHNTDLLCRGCRHLFSLSVSLSH